MAKTHAIPIGTLVEVNLPAEEECESNGIRLFVVDHYYDCDGTPLYALHWDVSAFRNSLPPIQQRSTVNGLTDEHLIEISHG